MAVPKPPPRPSRARARQVHAPAQKPAPAAPRESTPSILRITPVTSLLRVGARRYDARGATAREGPPWHTAITPVRSCFPSGNLEVERHVCEPGACRRRAMASRAGPAARPISFGSTSTRARAAVVAHAALTKAQLAQRRSAAATAASFSAVMSLAVGQARGQASLCRRVPGGQPGVASRARTAALSRPASTSGCRTPRPPRRPAGPAGRSPRSSALAPSISSVAAVPRRDRGHLHQVLLAEVAALARVLHEAVVVELVRLLTSCATPSDAARRQAVCELLGQVRGGGGGEGHHALRPQKAGRGRQQQARIDAAREGHADRAGARNCSPRAASQASRCRPRLPRRGSDIVVDQRSPRRTGG